MVLFNDVIQIFGVPDGNNGLMCLVVVLNGRRIGPTLIDRDFLWQSLSANGFAQKGLGHVPIPSRRQQKVNRVACFVAA
jgi:hypothetical protein